MVKPQQGHGLLLALVVLVVMMTALGIVASSLTGSMQEVRRELGTVSLIAMTDAAMAETLASLADDEDFGGIAEYDFNRGTIASEVRALGANRVEVLARASYGGRVRSLRAEVRLTHRGPLVLRLKR